MQTLQNLKWEKTTQQDAVLAAVKAGENTLQRIAAATGLPATTVAPLLSRLRKSGLIASVQYGRWVPRPVPTSQPAPAPAVTPPDQRREDRPRLPRQFR